MSIEWGSVAEWVSGAGSCAAVIIALYFSTSSERAAAARDRRSDQAIAHKTTSKLGLVLNAIADLRRHFESVFANAPTDNPFGAKWPYVQGLSGVMGADNIRLDADEIDFLFRLGDMTLAQELPLAMRRHEATVAAAQTYRDLRDALLARMPQPVAAHGALGTIEHTAEEIIALTPLSANTEEALKGLVERLASDWEFTLRIAADYGSAVRDRFHDRYFPVLYPSGLSKS